MPTVSILTPTYNHEAYIGQCIESVLAQTHPDWEMIIVDDGSTDRTTEIVESYKDPRIKLIRQKNQGVRKLAATYNNGLETATGGVIAILEGDDYWPPTKLAVQAIDFENPAVVLSSGRTAIVTGDDAPPSYIPAQPIPEEHRVNRPVGRAALAMTHPETLTYTFPVSTMLRTDTLRKIGGFQQPEYLPVADFPTFLRMTIEGEFRFHDEVLGYWRRHRESVTLGRLSEILEGAYRYAFEFLRDHRSELPVSDAELDALEHRWNRIQAMHCMLRGRILAKRGRRLLAAKAFREALLYRPARRTALAAAVASALTQFGLPVEWIYRLAKHEHVEKNITLDTGDQVVSELDMNRKRPVGRWRT